MLFSSSRRAEKICGEKEKEERSSRNGLFSLFFPAHWMLWEMRGRKKEELCSAASIGEKKNDH